MRSWYCLEFKRVKETRHVRVRGPGFPRDMYGAPGFLSDIRLNFTNVSNLAISQERKSLISLKKHERQCFISNDLSGSQ